MRGIMERCRGWINSRLLISLGRIRCWFGGGGENHGSVERRGRGSQASQPGFGVGVGGFRRGSASELCERANASRVS